MAIPSSAQLTLRLRTVPALAARFPVIAAAAAVAMVTLVTFIAVQVGGGPPNAWNHLAYGSIALGAYLYGWRGGILAALVAGLALGPGVAALGLPSRDTVDSMVIRAAAYAGVGALLGLMFERMNHAIERWQETAARLDRRQRDSMIAFARAAEAKDEDTGEHVVRVQLASERLARATGMSRRDAEQVGWAAMLHDIGKLHVPDAILRKPGPLTADEWEVMRQHPMWGFEILPEGHTFESARRIARWHHENFDGSGYPDGLARDLIPLDARIVRVADAFDAMTSDRCYAKARSIEQALEELDRWAGKQFDPELVRLMVDLMRSDDDLVARLAALRSRRGSDVAMLPPIPTLALGGPPA